MTITNIKAADNHMTATSKRVNPTFNWPASPPRNKTPPYRVARKMLEPTVLATIIPGWWRRPPKTATNLSGNVVASDKIVVPTTVPDSPSSRPIVDALCAIM
ncbi:hypothetical protein B0H67DRAFT_373437 [Lasiosphaeris hirsuta]|uniref:Uncharacterized protein n=1 Tax=Lasiosphaeris hirsuta TaxID=260670 RepID=A0AA39ZX93_9PEZI|nr:hypothetical protein B0H67DRAFT_373437 [Lasiosphaeris hirsuta]